MAAYATLAEALTYAVQYTLRSSVWTSASSQDQQAALNMSTRAIDQLNYQGCKAVSTQVNEFPRGVDTAVPQEIKDASIELALTLLDGVDTESEIANLRVLSEGIGSARVTYNRDFTKENVAAGIPDMLAWQKLLPYLRDPRELKLSRVT